MEVLRNDDAELLAEEEEAQLFATDAPARARPRRTAYAFVGFAAGLLLGSALLHHRSTPSASIAGTEDGMLPVSQLDEVVQCPGSVNVAGIGETQLVNSKVGHLGVDAGQMHLEGGAVVMHMEGRAYFADKCSDGWYDNSAYKSISLLGKTVQFTVDLSGTGCGCNVAFYFVSMKQNADPTKCQDHYCDANSVCGVACTEVDIMEANSLVWRSTLHKQEDTVGGAAGFGGTGPHQQTWTGKEYGPGSSCIDTNRPLNVLAHFPTHNGGKFQGMMVELQQEGSSCAGGLTASVGWYHFQDEDVLESMGQFLKDGMVPVVSYWKSDDLMWLDGNDVSGETPCTQDRPLECPLVGPRVSDIQVSDYAGFIHDSTMNIKPTTEPAAYGAGSYGTGAYGADAYGAAAPAAPAAPAGPAGVSATAAAAGWTTVQNAGQTYYYNTMTLQTSWDVPA